MSELPPAAQAQIERVLADLELAVPVALDTLVEAPPIHPGDTLVFFPSHLPIEPLVLDALRALVAIVSALPGWTGTECRQAVTAYQDHLLTEYATHLHRPSFIEDVRRAPWWVTFQQRLRDAKVPSIADQLQALKDRTYWTFDDIAREAKIDRRMAIRHFNGEQPPNPGSRKKYEDAFSTALNESVRLISDETIPRPRRATKKPPAAARRRATKKPPPRH